MLAVAFSPDGRFIALGSGDKTVKLWDAATGEAVQSLRGSWANKRLRGALAGCERGAIQPDARRITWGSWAKTVKVWDAATGEGF